MRPRPGRRLRGAAGRDRPGGRRRQAAPRAPPAVDRPRSDGSRGRHPRHGPRAGPPQTARRSRQLGIDVDLAPVLDVARRRLVRLPGRTFSDDPAIVADPRDRVCRRSRRRRPSRRPRSTSPGSGRPASADSDAGASVVEGPALRARNPAWCRSRPRSMPGRPARDDREHHVHGARPRRAPASAFARRDDKASCVASSASRGS